MNKFFAQSTHNILRNVILITALALLLDIFFYITPVAQSNKPLELITAMELAEVIGLVAIWALFVAILLAKSLDAEWQTQTSINERADDRAWKDAAWNDSFQKVIIDARDASSQAVIHVNTRNCSFQEDATFEKVGLKARFTSCSFCMQEVRTVNFQEDAFFQKVGLKAGDASYLAVIHVSCHNGAMHGTIITVNGDLKPFRLERIDPSIYSTKKQV